MAQEAEHVLGKDEVTGSNPVSSSIRREAKKERLSETGNLLLNARLKR